MIIVFTRVFLWSMVCLGNGVLVFDVSRDRWRLVVVDLLAIGLAIYGLWLDASQREADRRL